MGKISKDIVGYGLVKDVVICSPNKATNVTHAFIFRRDCGRDYLGGLVAVVPYNGDTVLAYYMGHYSTKKYGMRYGEIVDLKNGKKQIRFN